MKKSKFLLVMSIIALVIGVGDGISYFVMKSGITEDLISSLGGNAFAYSLSVIWTLAFAISEIVSGVVGILYWSRPDRISNCIQMGWQMIIFTIVSTISGCIAIGAISGVLASSVGVIVVSTVLDLIIPVLYLIAAYLFKKKAA